jgi:3-isopropylmalate/(R)-2-methylmalate dehydratase small subunit
MIQGKVHKYGDHVDTDVIIPARYCTSYVEEELAPHCLEDLDVDFVKKVRPGDILMAGENFGCGSSRENAPLAIKGAGVACVIARSYARIFFRNSINIGLPILESAEAVDATDDSDQLSVDLEQGLIHNLTKNKTFWSIPLPDEIKQIVEAGGMIPFVRRRLGVS